MRSRGLLEVTMICDLSTHWMLLRRTELAKVHSKQAKFEDKNNLPDVLSPIGTFSHPRLCIFKSSLAALESNPII